MSEEKGVKSLYKALDILENLSDVGEKIGVNDLSKMVGIPSSTAHRILSTLESRGYVEQTLNNKYTLGSKILELKTSVLQNNYLTNIALPILQNVVEKTRESTNLAVREHLEVIHILRLESPEVLRANIKGFRLPIHSSATGKVLLAYAPDSIINELPDQFSASTPNTITTKEELIFHLNKVKQQGYALDNEEGFTRVRSIAYPIYDNFNQVKSAISIVGPSERFDINKIPEYLKILEDASSEISKKAGVYLT
ncbi:IclR family transcriptional regulator [Anaerobacillus sp. MEB173]|uniref:IclR family transcriptional regulator n=1 Tax=Anaerobacillus sp. MEB173 TaxID=3383345 RepID=UPI003F93185C